VDVVIGLAFVGSAISGLVFLLPGEPASSVLGISYRAWNGLHTWSSLVMIAGVGVHLALHWQWMVSMTKQVLMTKDQRRVEAPAPAPARGGATEGSMSRRAFLQLGGIAAVTTGLVVTGLRLIAGRDVFEASGDGGTLATGGQAAGLEQASGVACPFGLVNDPYPGRCRFYQDSTGDGICDYSVPGSGSNLATGGEGSWGGGFRRRRPEWGQP
jgi:hypothetical protein